jgi:hypothetical protein
MEGLKCLVKLKRAKKKGRGKEGLKRGGEKRD